MRETASTASRESSKAPPDTTRLAKAPGMILYSSLPPDRSSGGRRLLEYLGIVLQELIEALIGERMTEQHVQHLERHRGDMGAGQGAIDDVCRRPHRSR